MTTYSPKTLYEGKYVALRPLVTEGKKYGKVAFVLPYGGGVRFKINPWLDAAFEVGYRWAFTDYLDDVSTNYPEANTLSDFGDKYGSTNPELSVILSDRRGEEADANVFQLRNPQRGNAERNDGYFLVQIKGEYTIKVTKQHYNINSNVSRFRVIKSIKRK